MGRRVELEWTPVMVKLMVLIVNVLIAYAIMRMSVSTFPPKPRTTARRGKRHVNESNVTPNS